MIHDALIRFAATGGSCNPRGGGFFGFPTWYKYLKGTYDGNNVCTPAITHINDTWLIVAACIEILLRIAVLLAVAMIVYGSFTYVTSQGVPDATAKARSTIINALLGLAIAVSSVAIVNFIGRSIN